MTMHIFMAAVKHIRKYMATMDGDQIFLLALDGHAS